MKEVDGHSVENHSIEQMAEHSHDHDHHHSPDFSAWISNEWVLAGISAALLLAGIVMDHIIHVDWFKGFVRFCWYAVSYIPVGLPVVWRGIRLAARGEVFTEFFLMSVATLGAFYLGEYPEGVTVMVFYAVGELVQGAAVNRAKRNIKALLDVRPQTAEVFRYGRYESISPVTVDPGEIVRVKTGERIPLDGTLISEEGLFNTAALTGESKPTYIRADEVVLAGMINEGGVIELKVAKRFEDSSLARIIDMVQNAQGRKAKTELFLRKFAKAYTPAVVFVALGIALIPYFFVADYDFGIWLYRALIFLVISCPCALVVAIPLGYFGGIGAASRHGILIKGSGFLDKLTNVGAVVMDKTGTLTKGKFLVQQVVGNSSVEWLPLVAALESTSIHPAAKAIVEYVKEKPFHPSDVEELRGLGVKGRVNDREVLVGNARLLDRFDVLTPSDIPSNVTVALVAIDRRFVGYIIIADEIKQDAKRTITDLTSQHIRTVVLSGDRQEVVDDVMHQLDIREGYGNLLPEDKVEKLADVQRSTDRVVVFIGDGINDAPVLAASDVGIAMGGLGSDVAIETADVVIQTDQPSKVVTAIRIGKATKRTVWQNIGLAFGIKVFVMILGAWGIASMWEAVFADVGVALLAILNAVRIQRRDFSE